MRLTFEESKYKEDRDAATRVTVRQIKMGNRYEMGAAKPLDREEELGGNRTQRGRLPQVLRTSANHRNTQRRFHFNRKKRGTKMKPSTVTTK